MEDILKDLEQLIEAYNQLNKETPIGARLALILLDNLAEIQMYRLIMAFFRHLNIYEYDLDISTSKRQKIENHFKDRVNFLVRYNVKNPLNSEEGTLDADDGEILKICHFIRNDAYHRDVLREDVLVPIIKVYFQIVNGLFLMFNYDLRFGYSAVPREQLNEFLNRYDIKLEENIGTEFLDLCILSRESLEEILSKFSIETNVKDTTQILCQNVLDRIKIVNEGLLELKEYEKLILNNEKTIDEILMKIQDYDEPNQVILSKNIKNWENKSKRILNYSKYGLILVNWWDIDDKLSKLELEVMKSLDYFNFIIDDQVDRYKLNE